jgi:uncharacterized protein YdeI (BOF family)
MTRATVAALAALMIFGFVATATAWQGRLEKSVVTISQAQQLAEKGDHFVIEGEITTYVRTGVDNVFVLNDGTGEMMIRIPDFVRREHGLPDGGEIVRVAGQYDYETLNRELWGLQVQQMERNLETPRKSIAQPPAALPTGDAAPAEPQAKESWGSQSQSITPAADREIIEKLRAARQNLLAARRDLMTVNVEYARAFDKVEKTSDVDADLRGRLAEAEARERDARKAVAPLIIEAERAGVSSKVLEIYKRGTL